MLHSKVTVIDGVWSAVGSPNFDHRSVLFNDEVDVVILGRGTAERLEAVFQEALRTTTPVEQTRWDARPFGAKLKEFLLSAWQALL
jgi:cardiolipin synthase